MFLLNKNIILVFMLSFFVNTLNANNNECRQNCLKLDIKSNFKHSASIYNDNPEFFWKLLNEMKEKAYSANSQNEINQFMKLLQINNPPAEVEEFLSEGLETLCAEKPVLFKEAMRLLDINLRAKLNKKLDQPLFREEKELETCRYQDSND